MMALLMMGSIINYLTRSSLSVAAPTLLQELHISAREYSWIVAAFQGTIMLQPLCYTSPVYPGASSILVPPAPKLLETRRTLEPRPTIMARGLSRPSAPQSRTAMRINTVILGCHRGCRELNLPGNECHTLKQANDG